jgi:hypothetical protein
MPQLANMRQLATRQLAHLALVAALVAMICAPDLALAQTSPFMTGASSLQTNILAWLTPVAIILVMVLGGMAMANRLLRLFACRQQRDLRSVQAAAGVAQKRRCALHDQVCGARTSADGATRFARGVLPRRRRTRARASKCAQSRGNLGCRRIGAGARSAGRGQRHVARVA